MSYVPHAEISRLTDEAEHIAGRINSGQRVAKKYHARLAEIADIINSQPIMTADQSRAYVRFMEAGYDHHEAYDLAITGKQLPRDIDAEMADNLMREVLYNDITDC